MDRYTKTILTVIAIALISIAAKDVDLFPIAEAQWHEVNEEVSELGLADSANVLPASTGFAYLCSSRLVEYSSSFGASDGLYGHLLLKFNDEAHCGGSELGYAYLFSEGATHSYSHPDFLFSEQKLIAYGEMTQRAAAYGQQVYFRKCTAPLKTLCLQNLTFKAAD